MKSRNCCPVCESEDCRCDNLEASGERVDAALSCILEEVQSAAGIISAS